MNKKTLLSTLGVIVLGALGSALWDFAKPVLLSLTSTVANLSTLGLESLRNAYYAKAALTLGRPVGIGLSITLVLTLISTLGVLAFHVISLSVAPHVVQKAKVAMIMCLGTMTAFSIQMVNNAYALQLANYYELLEVRAAPYMSDLELKKTRALFSQVKTKQDYTKVIDIFSGKIRSAGEAIPPHP